MIRTATATLGLLVAVSLARGADGRLHWQPGDVLIYRAEHMIQVSETVGTDKSETKSRLSITKRWQVLAVDPAGVATVQLTLLRLRQESTKPDGGVIVFDSTDPKTEEARDQLAKYVGPVLAVLRVDATGKVVEVKESKFGPKSRFESEPPFVAVFSASDLRPGSTWERAYQITLEPPLGTGEKYAAVQRYRCTSVSGGLATLALATELKSPPEAAADRVPLAQSQPTGEVVLDVRQGRLHSASLKVDQEVKGNQGEGSSYHFTSSYTEQYVGDR